MAIDLQNARDTICASIDRIREKYISISDAIWGYAETGLRELKSSRLLANTLSEAGFCVQFGVSGMETAFRAEYGSGKPVLCYVAEYDALPGLSQKASVPVKEPLEVGKPGHGCGHNLMGTAIVAAAIAVKEYMESHNISCTILVIGTPAEETIGSKAYMVRDGVFEDVDVCFGYHSSSFNAVETFGMVAAKSAIYSFTGKSAHAGAAPHLGRSALDACELMNVGVNYLREHVKPEVRMHWCYINDGGRAANVVPPFASLKYILRAKNNPDLQDVCERVDNIARGAALMTGTTMERETELGISNFIVNEALGRVCAEAMAAVGEPDFDDADFEMAQKFYDTFTEDDKDAGMLRINFSYPNGESLRNKVLLREVAPYTPSDGMIGGGSDLSDVSWVVPTAHFWTATYANGTPGHSWQQCAQVASPIGHKGMIFAAKAMALSAISVLAQPEIIEEAKDELQERTGGKYQSLLSPEQKPTLR